MEKPDESIKSPESEKGAEIRNYFVKLAEELECLSVSVDAIADGLSFRGNYLSEDEEDKIRYLISKIEIKSNIDLVAQMVDDISKILKEKMDEE